MVLFFNCLIINKSRYVGKGFSLFKTLIALSYRKNETLLAYFQSNKKYLIQNSRYY